MTKRKHVVAVTHKEEARGAMLWGKKKSPYLALHRQNQSLTSEKRQTVTSRRGARCVEEQEEEEEETGRTKLSAKQKKKQQLKDEL